MDDLLSKDPASDLWKRVSPEHLQAITGLLWDIPVPIGKIAQALNLEVLSTTLSPDISGLIKKIGNSSPKYQIQINNLDASVRQRFTAAHEVSHFLLHKNEIDNDGISDSILYRSRLSDKKEAEANRLAAAILIPWVKVWEWHQKIYRCAPSIENIDAIAKTFRVSSLAVGFRLRL